MDKIEIAKQFFDAGKNLTTLNGKVPIEKNWPNKRLEEDIIYNHSDNIGWVLGEGDLVIDVDPRNGGDKSFKRLEHDLSIKLEPTVLTASGGFHVYLKTPDTTKFKYKLKEYPGIEFLTKGKQCVIPGSTISSKQYKWANDDRFLQEESPKSIIDLLASELDHTPKENPSKHICEQEIRNMLKYVSSEERDVWVTVGMALHHHFEGNVSGRNIWHEWSKPASTYKDKLDIKKTWASFKKDDQKNPITIRTLQKMAYEAGWVEDVTCDFDNLDSAEDNKRFQLVQAGKFAATRDISWCIKHVLPKTGLAMVYGESGCGKTFFVLDICFALAQGITWNFHIVKQPMKIAYIAAEGAFGVGNRLKAYGQHNQLNLKSLPFYVIQDTPNLHKDEDKLLLSAIQAQGGADVIVVDTLAQVTPGANENLGEHMGPVLKRCQNLMEKLNCLVILVHHSGKDKAKGSRGWSGMKGALDTEININRNANVSVAEISKQKDGESGEKFPFELQSVCIGYDKDDDPITSCVLRYLDGFEFERPKPQGIWQETTYSVAEDFSNEYGHPIPEIVIINEAMELYESRKGKSPDKDSAMRGIDGLLKRGILSRCKGGYEFTQNCNSTQNI